MTCKLAIITLAIFSLSGQLIRTAYAEEDPELRALDMIEAANQQVDLTPPNAACDPDGKAQPQVLQETGFINETAIFLYSASQRFLHVRLRALTQVLYGEEVKILEHGPGIVRVAAVNQKTAEYPGGYEGWIPESAVSKNPGFQNQMKLGHLVATTERASWLYSDPECKTPLPIAVVYDTELPNMGEGKKAYQVMTPNGATAYLKKSDAVDASKRAFSPSSIVEHAYNFRGIKYVWGGTSTTGMDCSGFSYRLFKSFGVTIPRNSADQFSEGLKIEKGQLMPGDLVFFADDNGAGVVHHVGIYIGNGQMIHAPKTGTTIMISSISSGKFAKTYAGARRYGTGGSSTTAPAVP